MQASTKCHPDYIGTVPAAIALEENAIMLVEQPSRYWVLSLIAASAATWAMIFGAAKLLLALA